jgi:hypothetical protein
VHDAATPYAAAVAVAEGSAARPCAAPSCEALSRFDATHDLSSDAAAHACGSDVR